MPCRLPSPQAKAWSSGDATPASSVMHSLMYSWLTERESSIVVLLLELLLPKKLRLDGLLGLRCSTTWLMSEKVTRLTMGEPVWSWINGVFMPSGCTMLVEPTSPMLPTDAFLSAAGTRFSIWLPAEDWVSRAYDASLDQRSDFWADVDAELFADLRFELFNELELDRVVDKDGML